MLVRVSLSVEVLLVLVSMSYICFEEFSIGWVSVICFGGGLGEFCMVRIVVFVMVILLWFGKSEVMWLFGFILRK